MESNQCGSKCIKRQQEDGKSDNWKKCQKDWKECLCKLQKAEKVTIKSKKINTIGKNAFKNINKNATVKVPKAQKKKYAKLLNKAKLSKKVKIK